MKTYPRLFYDIIMDKVTPRCYLTPTGRCCLLPPLNRQLSYGLSLIIFRTVGFRSQLVVVGDTRSGIVDNLLQSLVMKLANRPFPLRCNGIQLYVTSCLGYLRRLAVANFPLLLYGNMAYVQTAAASCTGEIPSCLDTNPEFQHRPFHP